MATYVLVGGAWMGAWVWKSVAQRLQARNHDVFPLSLTGLGERVHLGRPETDLDSHIADVLNLIEFEDLSSVILVGHSYAGGVVTGVADRVPEALQQLVYCDSGPVGDGQSWLDLQSPTGQARLRRTVAETGDGWRLPFPGFPALGDSSSLTGLGQAERELMQRNAVGHPFGTWTQPLRLTHQGARPYRRVMILCENGQQVWQMAQTSLAAGERTFAAFAGDDWHPLTLDTGHWPMLSLPAELAHQLDGLGQN